MKKILLLGSTGSIGKAACACVRRHRDRFTIVGLGALRSVEVLMQQAREFGVKAIAVADKNAVTRVEGEGFKAFAGRKGIIDLVNEIDFDILLNAIVGEAGLRPTIYALKRGKRVALANKESLVIGGECIRPLIDTGQGELVPVDSEHSAILQCLNGERREAIESIILTASGGPFRELPLECFPSITPAEALRHPTWSMGPKITIDSATLMNKGFEIIEAHHLFRVPYCRLRVLIHPQSVVHSLVEFHDGSLIAQMGITSMEIPIQFALSYPERLPMPNGHRLNLTQLQNLTFLEPDLERFPCLRLCIEAGRMGGTYPAALNAANEEAVGLFLASKIRFDHICRILEAVANHHKPTNADSIESIEEADRQTRAWVRQHHVELTKS